ncbi:hypothetical protein IX324_000121 [Bacteroides pyogenes]|nr:hypothetical protein [Bacteroides pyogenes]
MKHQLCCIGHITLDKVVTPASTVYMPGGTAFYCSYAVSLFKNIDYTLVTSIGDTEMKVVDKLREAGIPTIVFPSKKSVYFENIYTEKTLMTARSEYWQKPTLSAWTNCKISTLGFTT